MKSKLTELTFEDEPALPFLKPYTEDFLLKREDDFKQLKIDYSRQDFDKIKELMHQWKGICEPYGFSWLGALARKVEADLKAGEYGEMDEYVNKIAQYIHQKKKKISDA